MTNSHHSLTRFAIASTAAVGLFGFSGAAMAMAPEALTRSAQAPYSTSQAAGTADRTQTPGTAYGSQTTDRNQTPGTVDRSQTSGTTNGSQTAATEDRSRAWWLLLPVGLGLLAWAALRDRDGSNRSTNGSSTSSMGRDNLQAQADARNGSLEVHEKPDMASLVVQKVLNGDSIGLTGARRNDWLEVAKGGWVRDADVRYNRTTAQLT